MTLARDPPRDPRRPQAFTLDDPALTVSRPGAHLPGASETEVLPEEDEPERGKTAGSLGIGRARGLHAPTLGQIFLSSLAGLLVLATSLWAIEYVSIALARRDAVGWTAFVLLAAAGGAALLLVLREVVGLMRLARLAEVRHLIEAAQRAPGLAGECQAVAALTALFADRPELRWPLARLEGHARDGRDPGELLRLAERELIVPLDAEARRRILVSAKRVGVVTALSPSGVLSTGFVLYENARLLRQLATLYGGRPGALGALKLARMIVAHIVATGGLALTDDLVGQFVGHGALRRVSHRLGEGAVNGVLTARIGIAAIHVCRPMPVIEARPVRLRDLLPELLRQRSR